MSKHCICAYSKDGNTSVLEDKTIALVDDHALFLGGLAGLIKQIDDRADVQSFHSGMELLSTMDSGAEFDLILTDLTMKAMNGLAVVSAVHQRSPDTPVLIVSGIESAVVENDMGISSACGFVHKSADLETLKSAIADGLEFKPAVISKAGIHLNKKPEYTAPMHELSSRQIEVLHLLGRGASNKEISEQLNISDNTVKSHLKSIFKILDVTRRTASIQKARALGLI